MASVPRLQEKYEKEILPALAEKTGRKNRLSLPRLQKIVVSMGVGSAITEKKHLDMAIAALTEITGQKPSVRRATKSVAGFRLRQGQEIGCKVTLRGDRMYEFLDRLISMAIPRIRDFRGFSLEAFDGGGNYTLGIAEQVVFPEIDIDKIEFVQGMDITFRITGNSVDVSREMLRLLGFPMRRP